MIGVDLNQNRHAVLRPISNYFCRKFKELLDENQEIKDVTTNVEKVTKFLKYCVSFGDKLSKRFNKEFESYQVANNLR